MEIISLRNYQTIRYFVSKMLVVVLVPLLLVNTIGAMSTVNASNDNSVSCHDRGVVDGEDHPFNQGTYDKCGNEYYQGFIEGCMSVEGNDRNTCESATDA